MSTFNPDLLEVVPGVYAPTLQARRKTSLVYPARGYNLDSIVAPIQVPASEITELQISLGASVKSIQQPVAVQELPDSSIVPDFSCYVVSSADGPVIKPKTWRQYGGRIEVEVNRDSVTATLRIYGAAMPDLAPFTIGFDDGDNSFAGLYLLGDGVGFHRQELDWETGLGQDEVAQDSTADYDNPYVQTEEQAMDAAHAALARRLGNSQTLVMTVTGVDGISGVDPAAPETAIGRVAGSRLLWDGVYYRVRSAVITPGGLELTCVADTVCGDFDAVHPADFTMADFDRIYAGYRYRDFDYDPLRTDG